MPKIPLKFFILVAFVYISAVRVDTMDVDASQYAEISMNMMKTGDYLHLYDRGMDYLDKPPFLFWVSAWSMKLLGINNLGYKYPSILFALLALYATYRLAKLLYNETTGRVAAMVLATTQGIFLWTNDIRCDTILMSWVIIAIWLIQEWLINKKWKYLIFGSAAIAFGMMTKGPIALMVPVFSFFTDWALKRQWKNFVQPAYLVGIVVIALLLIPMSMGLYEQFDMHPEKGKQGLRFFYWSQSFGRITGESPWKNGATIGFLMLNMLWSFLPWILIFIMALAVNIKSLFKQKFRLQPKQEWVSTGGFILTYLALGSSAYQLPHYILVAFPLAAITTAGFLSQMMEGNLYPKIFSFFKVFQVALMGLLLMALVVLVTCAFPTKTIHYVFLALCLFGWLRIVRYKGDNKKFIPQIAVGMLIINVFLTNHVYYPLLKYQVGNMVGRYIYTHHIPTNNVITYKMQDPTVALHFYAQDIIPTTDDITHLNNRKYILTMDEGLNDISNQNLRYQLILKGKLFKVSELTPEFLNPKTRNKELKNYYFVELLGE